MSLDSRAISGQGQGNCTAGLSIPIDLREDGSADAAFLGTGGVGCRNEFQTDLPAAQADVDTHGGVAA